MRFAAIARVTENKWITCTTKSEMALQLNAGDELQIENTICKEVKAGKDAVFIDHVSEDKIYCQHPAPALHGFQSYASVPIYRKNGSFFGTLCALDPEPAKINTEEIKGMFKLFADLISFHLEAVQEKEVATQQQEEGLHTAELREQFIDILGHDLKNPIATTRMSAEILLKVSKEDIVRRNAGTIKSSSFRMQALIENILDFARGKLGEGIKLSRDNDISVLQKALQQVINEIAVISPLRKIETEYELVEPVNCDPHRVAQLLTNLLANADAHGAENEPIKVRALSADGKFKLSVSNKGNKIPESARKHLFQPVYKQKGSSGKRGPGLGLFIASEIAQAHEGELLVSSTEEETCFTFVMSTEEA